jgi:hypothetical protein
VIVAKEQYVFPHAMGRRPAALCLLSDMCGLAHLTSEEAKSCEGF